MHLRQLMVILLVILLIVLMSYTDFVLLLCIILILFLIVNLLISLIINILIHMKTKSNSLGRSVFCDLISSGYFCNAYVRFGSRYGSLCHLRSPRDEYGHIIL